MTVLAPANGLLGAPGIFVAPPAPVREITGVRRDVAAIFGVAPQGQARLPAETLEADDDVALWLATEPIRRSVPVPVTSWDEYRYYFGGFEGPGRLPYAASAFFAGGGERAYIVRIVHDYGVAATDAAGKASGVLGDLQTVAATPIRLQARSEGAWGNRLRSTLSFETLPIAFTMSSATELIVDEREYVPVGSLVRARLPNDVEELRYVDASFLEPNPAAPGNLRRVTFASALSAAPQRIELVTGSLSVVDMDEAIDRREMIDQIGLRADHPRWLARVLINESALVWPETLWVAGEILMTDPQLEPVALVGDPSDPDDVGQMVGGTDRWSDIVPEDFWDLSWTLGDEVPGDGVQALAEITDVGLVLAPDLYEPEPIAPTDDVQDPPTLCGPDFAVEQESDPPPTADLAAPGLLGLALDPQVPGELARIVENQQQLAMWADQRRDLTLLLDAPLGLAHRQVLTWRTNFDSPHVAAYHPWIDTSAPDDGRDRLIRINPSAFASGIIAERELRLGVQFGPANQVAVGALRVADVVAPARHDELHLSGINVFQPERDGIRLTGARTLSRRSLLRQLSVARLMTVLRLSLEREMQWAVFEPNNEALWAEVRRMVHGFLTRLYNVGAFRGASTKEAFFVRCDRTTMTQNDIDNGRLICLVGVAPAEPIEYIILEIALEATQTISVEVST